MLIRIIAAIVVCVFSFTTIAWTCPAGYSQLKAVRDVEKYRRHDHAESTLGTNITASATGDGDDSNTSALTSDSVTGISSKSQRVLQGLFRRIIRRIFTIFIPDLRQRKKLVDEIVNLSNAELAVKGWQLAPVSYLQDILIILKRLPCEHLDKVKKVILIPWYINIFLFLFGAGGQANPKKGVLRATVMPHSRASQWVFAHELGHLVLDDKEELLVDFSWSKIKRNTPQHRILAVIFLAETLFSCFVSFAIQIAAVSSFISPSAWFFIPVLLATNGLGIFLSFITGGQISRFVNYVRGYAVHVLNPKSSKMLVSGYAMTSPQEEAAEMFAAYMVFPDAAKRNNSLSEKYNTIKEQVFNGREFTEGQLLGSDGLRSYLLELTLPIGFLFSTGLHIWYGILSVGLYNLWWFMNITITYIFTLIGSSGKSIEKSLQKGVDLFPWHPQVPEFIRQSVYSISTIAQGTLRMTGPLILLVFILYAPKSLHLLKQVTHTESDKTTVKKAFTALLPKRAPLEPTQPHKAQAPKEKILRVGVLKDNVITDSSIDNLSAQADSGDTAALNKLIELANQGDIEAGMAVTPPTHVDAVRISNNEIVVKKIDLAKFIEKAKRGDLDALHILKMFRTFGGDANLNKVIEKAMNYPEIVDECIEKIKQGDVAGHDFLWALRSCGNTFVTPALKKVNPAKWINMAKRGDMEAVEHLYRLAYEGNNHAMRTLKYMARQGNEDARHYLDMYDEIKREEAALGWATGENRTERSP